MGLQLAAMSLRKNDGEWHRLMFIIAAIYMAFGLVILVSFVASPGEVGIALVDDRITVESDEQPQRAIVNDSDDQFFRPDSDVGSRRAARSVRSQRSVASTISDENFDPRIGFCEALRTPGVLLWGLCFFCVKFAVYSLLLWMPLFLDQALHFEK